MPVTFFILLLSFVVLIVAKAKPRQKVIASVSVINIDFLILPKVGYNKWWCYIEQACAMSAL